MDFHSSASNHSLTFPCHPCFFIMPNHLEIQVTLMCCSLACMPLLGFTLWISCSPPLTPKTDLLTINLLATDFVLHVANFLTVVGLGSRFFWNIMITLMGLVRPLFQTSISMERFLAVTFPLVFLKYRPLRHRVHLLVAMWAASNILFGSGVIMCDMNVDTIEIYLYFEVISFCIVLFINSVCCVAITKALLQPPPGHRSSQTPGASKWKELLKLKYQTKAVLMVFFLELYMVCCYLPPVLGIMNGYAVEDIDFCKLHMRTLGIVLSSSGAFAMHTLYTKGKLNCFGKVWRFNIRTK